MSVVERGFDVRDHEIIQRVYLAAWTRLATNNPVQTPEEESLRQKNLRKRLFILAKRGAVDFEKLYAEVVAIYERPGKRPIRVWRSS
jgi:hypothetical protein